MNGDQIIQLANESPFLTFCIICSISSVLISALILARMLLRCINIRNNGWPPPHCDADGDFREQSTEDDEE